MVIIDPEDLHWVLPIFQKYGWSGLDACMAHIDGNDVLEPLRNDNYKNALKEIKELNPKVVSEH